MMSHKRRYKNHHQNIHKLIPIMYKKNYKPLQSGLYSIHTGRFNIQKSNDVIHQVHNLKKGNHRIYMTKANSHLQ